MYVLSVAPTEQQHPHTQPNTLSHTHTPTHSHTHTPTHTHTHTHHNTHTHTHHTHTITTPHTHTAQHTHTHTQPSENRGALLLRTAAFISSDSDMQRESSHGNAENH